MKNVVAFLMMAIFSTLSFADRIPGYQDFKFGMDQVEVKAVQEKVCERAILNKNMFAGCYNILGAKRQVVSHTGSGNKAYMFTVYMGQFNNNVAQTLVDELTKKYGNANYFASERRVYLANEGFRPEPIIAAFKDFSIILRIEGRNTLTLVYSNDEQAKKWRSIARSEDPDFDINANGSRF